MRHLPAVFEKVQRLRKTRRQIIMSTHSREMLADKGIAAEEVLWIDVTKDGSVLQQPNEADKRLIKSGMSPADVLLPRSSPANMEQLVLSIE